MFPTAGLTPETYLRDRVRHQIAWYSDRAARHGRVHTIVTLLVVAANLAVALLGYLKFTPWVGVATTLVGALTTYGGLRAADYLAGSFRATARELSDLERLWLNGGLGTDAAAFDRFVLEVERVLAREHTGWVTVVARLGEHAG